VKQVEEFMFRIIDMKVSKKAHRKVEHFNVSGHDTGSSSKSCKPMSLSAVVILYTPSMLFLFAKVYSPVLD
jgi:hypothetical protein